MKPRTFTEFLDDIAAGEPVTVEAFAKSAIGELPLITTPVRKLDPAIWGELKDDCPACNGNGWVTVRRHTPLLRGLFEEDCPECGGGRAQ